MKELISLNEVQNIETFILREVIKICVEASISYSLYAGSVLGAIRHKGPIPWDSDVDIIISIDDLNNFIKSMETHLRFPLYIDYYPKNKKYLYTYPRVCIKGTDSKLIHVDVFLYSAIKGTNNEIVDYFKCARKKLIQYHHKCDIIYNKKNGITNLIYTAYHFVRSLLIFKTKRSLHNEFLQFSKKYSVKKCNLTTELGCNRYGNKMQFKKKFWTDLVQTEYSHMQIMIPKDYDEFLSIMYGDYMKYPSDNERNKTSKIAFMIEEEIYLWCLKHGVLSVNEN